MKGKILVLDTAAFVKNVPIWDYAEEFYTCPEVIREIRDKQTKAFYKSLPVDVKIKEPSAASLRFVTEFSKKTGDYPSLSLADSKVLALTYEFDIQENGGSDHLKKEPEQSALKSVTNITTKVKTSSVPKNIPGFYYPKRRKCKSMFGSEYSRSAQSEICITDEYKQTVLEPKPELLNQLNSYLWDNSYLDGYTVLEKDFDMTSQLESYVNSLIASDPTNKKAEEFKTTYPHLNRWMCHIITLMEEADDLSNEMMDNSEFNIIPEVDENLADENIAYNESSGEYPKPDESQPETESQDEDGWKTISKKSKKYSPSDYAPSVMASVADDIDSDYDSDEDGWISSSNIHLLKHRNLHELEEPKNILTACISSDFAVQNMLKHIGLNIVGVDGKLIRRMQSYLLRCYTCFKLSTNMERLFCFNCGNKTLKRVAVTVKEDGSQEIWINATRPINTKGINKPIPLPRGGKYSCNPILVADQRFPQQRLSKAAKLKSHPLDENYIAGNAYFAKRDIYSRAAGLGRIEGNNPKKFQCTGRKRK